MPYKNEEPKEKRVARHAKYYKNNKEKCKERLNKLVQRNRNYVQDLKKNGKCCDCNESRWQCLDFDHIDPSLKTDDIKYLTHHGVSLERIQNELDKCVLRCANCHRYRHAIENNCGQ